jgi:hypothetical protein
VAPFLAVQDIYLFSSTFGFALGPIQPHMEWLPRVLSIDIKWLWYEADHSPPSSAEVKNEWSFTSIPPYVHGMHRDNFIFYFQNVSTLYIYTLFTYLM